MLGVMDHLGIKKAIIGGMSMGGPVVLEMYREAPQRFKGMILIDSTTSPASPVEQGEWTGFGKLAQQKGVAAMVPLLMPNMLTAKTRTTDMPLVKFLGSIVKQGSVKGAVGGGNTLATRPDSPEDQDRRPGPDFGGHGRPNLPRRDGEEDAPGHQRLPPRRHPRRGPRGHHREAGGVQRGDFGLGVRH